MNTAMDNSLQDESEPEFGADANISPAKALFAASLTALSSGHFCG
jgi:hypothetical protein